MSTDDSERLRFERLRTAKILVAVRDFRAIGEGGCSCAEISVTDSAGGVVEPERDKDDVLIRVSSKVYLGFEVVPMPGDGNNGDTYAPVGIGFQEESDGRTRQDDDNCGDKHALRDPLGHRAFPECDTRYARGTTLLFVLDLVPEVATFKFSLIIQRNDGKLGIIDPKIHNWPM